MPENKVKNIQLITYSSDIFTDSDILVTQIHNTHKNMKPEFLFAAYRFGCDL